MAGVDISSLVTKSNLSKLKAEADKIDVDKLKTAPSDLSQLSYVVDNDIVKKLCMIN